MILTARTKGLLIITALCLGLVLVDRTEGPTLTESVLPTMSALDKEAVDRIELTRLGRKITLTREGETWRVTQPLQATADHARVRSLLTVFRKPIVTEVLIDPEPDEARTKEYGLHPDASVVAEFFAGDDSPVLSFTVGNDVPGGASLIRLSGSEAVYRAEVGGRGRYARDANDWRNRMVTALDATAVTDMRIDRADGGALHFSRASIDDAKWEANESLVGVPLNTRGVDQQLVDAISRTLTTMRASEIHAEGFGDGWERPLVKTTITMSDGTQHTLEAVESPEGKAMLVRVDAEPNVYRVARASIDRLLLPKSGFVDHTVFAFPRNQLDTMTLIQGSSRVRLRHDQGNNRWLVIEPIHMDADTRRAQRTLNALSNLRATTLITGKAPEAANLDAPGFTLEAKLVNGTTHTLQVGGVAERKGKNVSRYARHVETDLTHVLSGPTIETLRHAFLQE